jgi:hypothetical protein
MKDRTNSEMTEEDVAPERTGNETRTEPGHRKGQIPPASNIPPLLKKGRTADRIAEKKADSLLVLFLPKLKKCGGIVTKVNSIGPGLTRDKFGRGIPINFRDALLTQHDHLKLVFHAPSLELHDFARPNRL